MTPHEFERILNEAQGYLELELPIEAWNALETLPHDAHRLRSEVIALRVLVCAKAKRWNLGAELVKLISSEHPLFERSSAGTFHLAHALWLCEAGDIPAARVAVGALCTVYPEGKEMVTGSPSLLAMWP